VTIEPHRGAALLAREIGRLEVAERYRLGWGSSAERAWESAVQRSLDEAARLEKSVGPSVSHVWRRALRAARYRTWLRTTVALGVLLLPLTTTPIPTAALIGVLVAYPPLRAARNPKLSLLSRHEIPSLTELAGEFGLKTAIKRKPGEVRAYGLTDPQLASLLVGPLDRLTPEVRELMTQLQPGFPGTISELEACALVILHQPPPPVFPPRSVRQR
jgi:hypothetical protein